MGSWEKLRIKDQIHVSEQNIAAFSLPNPCSCLIILFNMTVNAKLPFFRAVTWMGLYLIHTHTHAL